MQETPNLYQMRPFSAQGRHGPSDLGATAALRLLALTDGTTPFAMDDAGTTRRDACAGAGCEMQRWGDIRWLWMMQLPFVDFTQRYSYAKSAVQMAKSSMNGMKWATFCRYKVKLLEAMCIYIYLFIFTRYIYIQMYLKHMHVMACIHSFVFENMNNEINTLFILN